MTEDQLITQLASLTLPAPLRKRAGLFETLGLDSIGDSVKSFFHEHFHNFDEVPGGYATSFVSLLAPAVLFRINPLFGILATIADQFGLNFEYLVKKIGDALKPKIEAGEPITPEEVNQIGESIGGVSATAFLNGLNWMVKEARRYGSSYSPEMEIPFLSGGDSDSILGKIFGNLGKQKGKRMIVGFIVWLVKTALAGAGLLAGGELVGKMLGHQRRDRIREEEAATQAPSETSAPEVHNESTTETHTESPEPVISHPDVKKMVDEAYHGSQKMWLVPLVGNGSIADTLRIWTLDLYPELNQYEDIDQKIMICPEFRSTAQLLATQGQKFNGKLVMPAQFTSRQQVVDRFIDHLKSTLGK